MPSDTWLKLCDTLKVSQSVATDWLSRILTQYSKPDRYYYKCMLNVKVEYLINLVNVKPHIVLASYFQYYEFDVKKDYCEVNCETFKLFCEDAHIENPNLLKSVLYLMGDLRVGGNNCYDGGDDDLEEDLKYFQDLDLIILGSPRKEYLEYTEVLQKIYSHLDIKTYQNMRLKILQKFLRIPYIYSNELFRDKYEAIARQNIEEEIVNLQK